MKIAVLGSNAFSGQDFVDLVLTEGAHDVIGISRSPEKHPAFLAYRRDGAAPRFRFFQADFNRDMPELLALLDRERPDWIVNFAAQSEVGPSWDHPEHWFATNTVALAGLVNHLRRQDYLQRFLHISSPEAYGSCEGRVTEEACDRPSTPYAASKAAADMLLDTYCRQFGFPLVSVRATNVYGARQQLFKIIPASVLAIRQGRTIALHGGGRAIKSYIHVRDVSRGELAILRQGRIGQRYHLSPDAAISVRDLVAVICRKMGVPFDRTVSEVAERPGQDAAYVIDSSRARRELGWTPTIALDAGLDEVIAWVDAQWDVLSRQPLAYQHKP